LIEGSSSGFGFALRQEEGVKVTRRTRGNITVVRVLAAIGSVSGGRKVSFGGYSMAIVFDRKATEHFTELTTPPVQVRSASPDYREGKLTGILISSAEGEYHGTAYVNYFNSQGEMVGASSITEFTTDENSRTARIAVEQRSGASSVEVDLPGLKPRFPMTKPRR
jgi:hypothetical protein